MTSTAETKLQLITLMAAAAASPGYAVLRSAADSRGCNLRVVGSDNGRGAPRVNRNRPCPCGSGKKAKKCCN